MLQALLKPRMNHLAEIGFGREPLTIDLGRRELGQLRLAQLQHQIATPRNFQRVGQRRWHIGKQCLHLRRGFEILLPREAACAPWIGQYLALGNTDPCLMGFKILWRTELHRMGGHHRQRHACSQFDAGRHMRLVIRAPGALQFQIKTVWKKLRELQGHFTGPCFVALQQGLSDRPGLGTGQHNQAFLAFAQPGQPHHGRPRACVLGPGSGQQLTHIQVALLVLHQ